MSYMNVVLEYISQNFFETDTYLHEYISTISMIFPQTGSLTSHNPQYIWKYWLWAIKTMVCCL